MKKSRLLLSSGGVVALAALGIATLAGTASYAEGANTEVNLIVLPTISITATENLNLEATPTVDGKFTSGDISVNVITNSQSGYKLYLSSSSEGTALENLVAGTSIPTLSTASSSNDMANNTWGYTLSDTFNPVPANTAPEMIKETSTAATTTADVTTVTIGAKVDTTIPSGSYTNTILFTATAKDNPIANLKRNYLTQATSMQDPNIAQYCRDTYTPTISATTTTTNFAISGDLMPEATLTDSRDGKSYVVRKYADGNCWMAQNLDLEGARTLTASDTDLNGDITSFALPDNVAEGTTWDNYAGDVSRVVGATEGDYLTNTSGTNYTLSDTGNPWEHRGNYYSWYAATAGAGSSGSGNVNSSICPKGWQLPNDGYRTTEKSWSNLVKDTYGIASNVSGDITHESPFNQVRAGFYNGSSFTYMGELSYYWTNYHSGDSATAYRQLDSYYVLTDPYNANNALSIRCVAR